MNSDVITLGLAAHPSVCQTDPACASGDTQVLVLLGADTELNDRRDFPFEI